jgi:hypothetical protein
LTDPIYPIYPFPIYPKKMSEAKQPEKKVQEPQKRLYGGYATKEELEARRAQAAEEMRKSKEEWVKLHGPGVLPKVN